jgi:hypothetical protein
LNCNGEAPLLAANLVPNTVADEHVDRPLLTGLPNLIPSYELNAAKTPPMSLFDEIANDDPLLVRRGSTLLSSEVEHGHSTHSSAAPMIVEELALHSKHKDPEEFVKLLRQVCLNEVYRDTLLRINCEEAQSVVDAIQLVSA